jgi:hypothetical protein
MWVFRHSNNSNYECIVGFVIGTEFEIVFTATTIPTAATAVCILNGGEGRQQFMAMLDGKALKAYKHEDFI